MDSMQKRCHFLVPEAKIGSKCPTPSRVENWEMCLTTLVCNFKKYIKDSFVLDSFFGSKTCEKFNDMEKKIFKQVWHDFTFRA